LRGEEKELRREEKKMDIDVFYIWGEGGEEKELRREEKRKKWILKKKKGAPSVVKLRILGFLFGVLLMDN